jgi:hypothetical protein
MKVQLLREYFKSLYESKYHRPYLSNSSRNDMAMLNRLIYRYNEAVVLYAMEAFFNLVPQDKATINYFSTGSFFGSKFDILIKLQKILPWKRRAVTLQEPTKSCILSLVNEYIDYTLALYPTSDEIARKTEIERILGELDAKRLRSEAIELNLIKA